MGKKGKRTKESEKHYLIWLIRLILLGVMICSGYEITLWIIDNGNTTQMVEETSKYVKIDEEKSEDDINKYNIDFQELKNKNSDVVAWLKVPGTKIEYPVVRTTDNSFYLTHSLDKTDNKAGWAFMDYKNKLDGEDKNIIIYGHNRRDGSMFESLKNVLTDDWFNDEANRKIIFITEAEKSFYEVFSVYKIEAEDYYIQTSFDNYSEFLKKIKERSTKDFNINIDEQDSILTISTCDNNNNYRVVLHAKKINNQQ